MKIKKLFTFIGIISMIFCLCSCGETDADTETDTEEIITDTTEETSELEEIIEAEVPAEPEETYLEVNPESYFEVHYLDVGQADASLIMCDNEYMLIDGGNAEDSSLIYAYLKEHGIAELEYMICTHAHEDHVGGLAGALNFAQVKNVFCPTTEFDTETFKNFLKYLDKQNKEIVIPEVGTTFELGSAYCTVLASNTIPDDPNNSSIALKIEYRDTAFLFSGDAEQVVETGIIEAGFDIACDVMKVPHHGSDTSLSYRWLNEAMPEHAVISVGKENQYGHPCEDTLSKLRDADVTVYRTDMQGHIICISDGENVTFETEKNEEADMLVNAGPGTKSEAGYILNVNTKKIHYPSCSSVKQMKEKNKQVTDLPREELIEQGYSPCGNCHP